MAPIPTITPPALQPSKARDAAPILALTPLVSPAPVPSAFGQTNTFTYGAAPTNNYADATQSPQIFFVQVQPTVVRDGQSVTISVITSTNVSILSFGPTSNTSQVLFAAIGPGKWQSTFNFSAASFPSTSGNVNEMLSATTGLGTSTSLRIPFALVTR